MHREGRKHEFFCSRSLLSLGRPLMVNAERNLKYMEIKKKKKAFDALSKHKGPVPKSARSQFSNVHILSFLYSNLSHNHGAQGDDPLQNTHFWGN